MQGGHQSTPGASREWHATPETHAPPGEPSDRRVSGRAVASRILGFISLPVAWIPFVSLLALVLGITGLVLGIRGFRECNRTPELKGLKAANLGTTLCSITIIIALAGIYWSIAIIAVNQ